MADRPRWIPQAPGVVTLRAYDRGWLRGDVLAGATVAAYLIPQVMAYSGLAGLPPVAGLWAALPALALYALLGSSRQLSVGPESTTALMTATVIAPLAAGDPGRYAALAAGLAVIVGLLCLVCWAIRLGFVADLLSKPILVGYMAGVAIIMIIGQLERLTGVPVDGGTLLGEVWAFIKGMGQIHLATVVLGALVLAFLYVVQRQFPKLPGPLLAVLLATGVTALFGLQDYGIETIGKIPSGLPPLAWPDLTDFADLLLPAVGVMLVGYTDNMLTARAFAARHRQEVDADQELLALGVANLGSGVLRGFPVSSSGSRTALADAAGARSQVYSLTALVLVICTLLFASPVLSAFPTAALGAIIVYAALRLIDLPGFRKLAAFRRSELLLALAAFAGVLLFDILYGVLAAVALSVAEMLARVARPHDAVLGIVPGVAGMHDVDDYPQARTVPGLMIYRYDSPLFFANAQDLRRRALAAVGQAPDVKWFVLNAEAIVEVDITAMEAVEELRNELTQRGIVFGMAHVKQELMDEMVSFGLAEAVGRDRIFHTLPTAVAAFRAEHPQSTV
ncbi:SulP family inorganic anion transporter [Catellatospora coxensis]|uniref:Sodium-independent anion transporter n=1 Tax=Catellatospora coxensis TaxID=310354 RepID=A0A8J3P8N5_9ACTN|nr:sodium-independent anion transporter [Catellatospora coxensis]